MYIHRHVHVPVDMEALVFLDVCMSFFCESCRSNCYCSEVKTLFSMLAIIFLCSDWTKWYAIKFNNCVMITMELFASSIFWGEFLAVVIMHT